MTARALGPFGAGTGPFGGRPGSIGRKNLPSEVHAITRRRCGRCRGGSRPAGRREQRHQGGPLVRGQGHDPAGEFEGVGRHCTGFRTAEMGFYYFLSSFWRLFESHLGQSRS
jgi:hypothetical protein